jgi:hypothetical protein
VAASVLRRSRPSVGRKGEKEIEKEKWAGPAKIYFGLSRQPAWQGRPVAPESLARQGRPHAPPRQLRSTTPATVASLIAPMHVVR